MKCPRDGTPLTGHPVPRGTVNRCPKCHGLWLAGSIVVRHIGQPPRPGQVRTLGDATTRACPTDGEKLSGVHHHGIEVDVCSKCTGAWLDAGELEHIVRRRRGQTADRVVNEVINTAGDVDPDFLGDAVGAVIEFIVEGLFSGL